MWKSICGLCTLFLVLAISPGHRVSAIDFETDVAPILVTHCLECHQSGIAKGGLSLATSEGLVADDLIQPGDAGASRLLEVILPDEDGHAEMPLERASLTASEVDLIRQWINQDAQWPESVVLRQLPKADKSWWAYQPIAEVELPDHSSIPASWASRPIDRFIFDTLQQSGLAPNLPASKQDLIRRVSYGLTGLPPSESEIREFMRDESDTAYDTLVDRLLESPRYGEHWGRHWLDVVRFGESRGYERNTINHNLWPFRDYVIDSLNQDRSFRDVIREHLAGDVIAPGDPQREVGTAFLVAGPYDDVGNQDAAAAKTIRANTLDDVITATGSAFLGLTVNCARCHDHKFDPILQADYYRLRAALEGVNQGERVVATAAEKETRKNKLGDMQQQRDAAEAKIRKLENDIAETARQTPDKYLTSVTREKVDRTGTEDRFDPVTAQWVRLVPISNDVSAKPGGSVRVDEFEIWTDEAESRNVALASAGAVATASARSVQDSADNAARAYGALLTNDGEFGRRWISAGDHILTIKLAQPERIARVFFSSDRPNQLPGNSQMTFVGEYSVQVSSDGRQWQTVSESWDREPINESFLQQRMMRFATSPEQAAEIKKLKRNSAQLDRKIKAVPGLRKVWAGKFTDAPPATHLAIGGDPNRPGLPVVTAGLSTLSTTVPGFQLAADAPDSERRLALADWITSEKNSLALRVLVNRIWHYHFGTGIVATPSDFGYMGGRPSHPELLDYLAGRLRDNDWKLKSLHREILMSQAYRQSAGYREPASRVDANSRLLWRFPPRRLSAEEIRDSMLQVAGKLDLKMGGPGFRLYLFTQDNVCTYHPLDTYGPETYRRTVYHQSPRSAKVDLLTEFDCPDPSFATPRRATTTTPLQALTLMNHQFTTDMAAGIAQRCEAPDAAADLHVQRAFELIYGRPASESEIQTSLAFCDTYSLTALCRVLLNSNEFVYVQ